MVREQHNGPHQGLEPLVNEIEGAMWELIRLWRDAAQVNPHPYSAREALDCISSVLWKHANALRRSCAYQGDLTNIPIRRLVVQALIDVQYPGHEQQLLCGVCCLRLDEASIIDGLCLDCRTVMPLLWKVEQNKSEGNTLNF